MLEVALQALMILFDPARLIFMFIGIAVGLVIGFLPGLGGMVGMSILLPFIFGMDPYSGMAMLIGMAAVIHTSDTFPSVLIGMPGSSGAQATILDGYPLAQKGEASRALGAAFFSSMIGGIIGGVVLFLAIPVFRPLVLAFKSPELLMMSIMGLSMVGILAGNAPLKGILAGAFGLMLGAVGVAPAVPEYRYTFDILYLSAGVPLIVMALGLFAFPELLDLLAERRSIAKCATPTGSGILQGIRDAIREKWLILWSAGIGALVGFIPGLGGAVVNWVNYGAAMRLCKNTENFGKGDIRGVIAPESGNNAKEGGALIPALMFGIPGSGTTAILLGGLTLMGVHAGASMVTTELTLLMVIIWTLVLANIFGAAACILFSKVVARICQIPAQKLVPFILVILLIGSYQANRHWGDIIFFVIIGVLGWVMKHLDWPRPPLIIGFVLSTATERYLWISMSFHGFAWLTHPGVIIIGCFIIFLLWGGIKLKSKSQPQNIS